MLKPLQAVYAQLFGKSVQPVMPSSMPDALPPCLAGAELGGNLSREKTTALDHFIRDWDRGQFDAVSFYRLTGRLPRPEDRQGLPQVLKAG